LKKVIRETTKTKNENTSFADDGNEICPVFVVTTRGRTADGPLKLFRSYSHDRDDTPIWMAARATSAAPIFFPPAYVDVPATTASFYVDGGPNANNPTWEAINEGKKYWRTRKCFIVSVGTGIQKPVDLVGGQEGGSKTVQTSTARQSEPTQNARTNDEVQQSDRLQPLGSLSGSVKSGLKKLGSKIGRTLKVGTTKIEPVTDMAAQVARIPGGVKVAAHIIRGLIELSTNSERMHRQVWGEAHSQDESVQFPYFRFNVLRGMDQVGLEEWRKVERMTAMTLNYLGDPEVKEEMRKCAEGLLNPSAFEST
jgi:predicted acylesterase/phospholipase RssA